MNLEISPVGAYGFRWHQTVVDANGEGVSGATIQISLIRESDQYEFDWNSGQKTFKNASWTTRYLTMTELTAIDGCYFASSTVLKSGGGTDFLEGDKLLVAGTVVVGSLTLPFVEPVTVTRNELAACRTANRINLVDTSGLYEESLRYSDGTSAATGTEIMRFQLKDIAGSNITAIATGTSTSRRPVP